MAIELNRINKSEFPLFYGLSDAVLQELLDQGETRHYQAGEPIVVAKDFGQTFYLILEGIAKVTLNRPEEQPINLIIFKPGEFFGELALLENSQSRTANVNAMTELRVFMLHKDPFYNLMRKYPDIAINLSRGLAQRFRQMNERIVALTLPNPKKIARTLMVLAHKPDLGEMNPIFLPNLSNSEWAQFCHESETEFLRYIDLFEQNGCLERMDNGQIVLRNVARLKDYAV